MEMFCQSVEESENSLNLEPKQYVQLLVPQLPEDCYTQSITENQTENQRDLHYIMTLSLLEQVRTIMKHGEKSIAKKNSTYIVLLFLH